MGSGKGLFGKKQAQGERPAVGGKEHAILSTGYTQYILTDISPQRLRQGMLGSQLAWGLDIQSESQVEELFSTGKTETTNFVGMKSTLTLTWCSCSDPASHKRKDAAQLGL